MTQDVKLNKFKVANVQHNHPVISTRRKPGERRALLKARKEKEKLRKKR